MSTISIGMAEQVRETERMISVAVVAVVVDYENLGDFTEFNGEGYLDGEFSGFATVEEPGASRGTSFFDVIRKILTSSFLRMIFAVAFRCCYRRYDWYAASRKAVTINEVVDPMATCRSPSESLGTESCRVES